MVTTSVRTAVLAAALSLAVGLEALAQTAPEQPALAEAKPEQVEPGSAAPDPLTPPKLTEPAPAAPGAATLAVPTASSVREPDAIVAEVRRKLGPASAASSPGHREDRAALAAFYADGNGQPVWTAGSGLSARGTAVLAEIRRAADWGLEPSAFELPPEPAVDAKAEALADIEIKTGFAVLKYARHARGGRVDPGSISSMIDHRPRIYEPKSVLVAIAASDAADTYLSSLNPRHQGFERLRQALLAARTGQGDKPAATKGGAETIQRILVNMERWRWVPDDLGAFYVWDNVPEQLTRVMEDGKAVLTERIVVGKPITQTPEFSADMRFVIFHPTWGVPEGIKTNELGPMLRRASSNGGGWLFGDSDRASRALKRHELRVTQNGREVNPDSINWSSVDVRQFQFTQPPSGKNVLGIVKFRFPNRFDVYMHDTQDKQLFASGTRAFSHGCMRVQNPMRLAELVLARDKGWSAEKVHGFVARNATHDVTLDKPVPVHVTYFTASVDDDGKLKLHGDLYGKDARVASALAGRAVSFGTVPVAAASEAEPAPGAKAKGTKREKQAVRGKQPVQQSAASNPFSGLSGN